jgi:small subunit ribosomal protein S6
LRTYEAVVIFTPQIAGEALVQGKNIFEGVLTKQGGKIINAVDMGKRVLGYIIKKMKEGCCLAFDFELEPDKANSLREALKLVDGILKFTIVVKQVAKPVKRRVRRKKVSRPK